MVALEGGRALIQILGLGTLKFGPALRQFIEEAESAGVHEAVVDLSCCESLDSTMMGLFAGFGLRLRRGGGRLVLSAPNERVGRLLHTLGVDRVAEVSASAAEGAADVVPLEGGGGPAANKAILEAHESLIEADEANRERFRDVIEFLRDHMRRHRDEEVRE